MKRAYKNILLLAVIVGLSTIIYLVVFTPWPGATVSTREVTSGSVYIYEIGDSKEEIIKKSSGKSFTPEPKPKECPKNWIEVSNMNETQKQCLLNSNQWEAGFAGEKACERGQDYHVTLNFITEKLASITVRCTKSI